MKFAFVDAETSNCLDNATIESWFSTLKSDLGERFARPAEVKNQLFDYVEVFYNQQRRHSALEYVSPAAYEKRELRWQRRQPVDGSGSSPGPPPQRLESGRQHVAGLFVEVGVSHRTVADEPIAIGREALQQAGHRVVSRASSLRLNATHANSCCTASKSGASKVRSSWVTAAIQCPADGEPSAVRSSGGAVATASRTLASHPK